MGDMVEFPSDGTAACAPLGDPAPEWGGLTVPGQGHFAEHDDNFPPVAIAAIAEELRGTGRDVTIHDFPGTGRAFLNETDPLGTYNPEAAKTAWDRCVAFLHDKLG